LQINPEYLRRHFATLSDEALRAIDRTELVALAQKCYDDELVRRGPLPRKDEERWTSHHTRVRPQDQLEEKEDSGGDSGIGGAPGPEWLDEAACACAFAIDRRSDFAADAGAVRELLEAAGIPCHVAAYEVAPIATQREYRVMVPGRLNLLATSILDKEMFNAEIEAEWKTHFEELTDEELGAVEPEVLFGGLLDRIERVRKAYDEECGRRKSKSHGAS
jgi:hypothetical protein